MTREAKLVGSVSMFEYPIDQVPTIRSFLEGHLWGDDGMPTYRHPEEMVASGNVILILCFDPGDPAGDAYAEYLRSRHHARISNRCPALFELEAEIADARASAPKGQAPLVARHEAALLACSLGAVRVGELARELNDWRRAESAFRRAIQLDAQGDALTSAGSNFAANYGLALAVSMLGRAEEAARLFEHALEIAHAENNPRFIGWAEFNLACARAESGGFELAAEALRAAIAIDPMHKVRARTDKSFEKARARPDFKRLLD